MSVGVVSGTRLMLFDGQSFNYAPTVVDSYAGKLITQLPANRWQYRWIAVGGTPWDWRYNTMLGRITHPKDRDVVVIDFGGVSDILTSYMNYSAATAYSWAQQVWGRHRTNGVDTILAATVTPMTAAASGNDANFESRRIALNDLIRGSSDIDGVIDIAGLANAANPANTTYYYDGLHPTATLAQEFANLAEVELAALGLPT